MSKYSEVSECVKFLVEHFKVYYVDSNGYIKGLGNDEPVQVKGVNGKLTDLIVFQEVIKDPNAMILNPFAEGVGKSNDQDWLFQAMSTAFTFKTVEVMNIIINLILAQKEGAEFDISVTKLISPFVKLVDDQTAGEIKKITVNYVNFMSIYYKRNTKTAMFRCALFEGPSFRSQFGKIRNKTWQYMEKVFHMLFELKESVADNDKLEEYQYKSSTLGYPRLDSQLRVFYKLYEVTNTIFEIIDSLPDGYKTNMQFQVDITTFGEYLEKFDSYFDVAKSAIQPNAFNKAVPTATGTPIMKTNNLPREYNSTLPRFGTNRLPAQNMFQRTNLPKNMHTGEYVPGSYQTTTPVMTGYVEPIMVGGFSSSRLCDTIAIFQP